MRVQMCTEISKLHKQFVCVTMLDVTHDQVEAMTMGDCIAADERRLAATGW